MSSLRLLLLFAVVSLAIPSAALADSGYYLLIYRPGPNWDDRVPFASQPGIKAHKAYLEELFGNDVVRMGGEIADQPGAMALLRVGTRDEARAVADKDPAVLNRILDVDIVSWQVDLSSMRHMTRRQEPVRDPNVPFRIERLDPDAPINLKD